MPVIDLSKEEEFDPQRPRTKLLHDTEAFRLVLFCLEPGQVVEPHISESNVVMHMLRGRGAFTVGETTYPAGPGTVAVCAPREPHGMSAEQRSVVIATIAPRPH